MTKRWIDCETWTYPSKKKKDTALGWKLLSAAGLLLSAVLAVIGLCLKKKNDIYLDALIDLSDQLPEDEEDDSEARRSRWQSAHAPANRKTVEERLADQRGQEM